MKKEIKKIGTQRGVTFTNPEMKIQGWNEGDILDLSDAVVIKHQQASNDLSNILAKQNQPKIADSILEEVDEVLRNG